MVNWPSISGRLQDKFFGTPTADPLVPVTLGESSVLHDTDIPGLCLTAVYQLLDEGTLTIEDVHGAYTRAKERATSSSRTRNS